MAIKERYWVIKPPPPLRHWKNSTDRAAEYAKANTTFAKQVLLMLKMAQIATVASPVKPLSATLGQLRKSLMYQYLNPPKIQGKPPKIVNPPSVKLRIPKNKLFTSGFETIYGNGMNYGTVAAKGNVRGSSMARNLGAVKNPSVQAASGFFGAASAPFYSMLAATKADDSALTSSAFSGGNAISLQNKAISGTTGNVIPTDIHVEMINHNTIRSEMDLDQVVRYLTDKVYEGLSGAAEGIHC